MVKEQLNVKIMEFEKVLQKVASDITNGLLSEKLSPSEMLKKTENYVNCLIDLTEKSGELMLVLKPEKALTIKSKSKNLTQTLTNFKNVLLQNTPEPLANSRLAFEQLKKALADSSDFLFLMREIKDNPSPLIDTVISLKKASQAKTSIINIQAKEDIQPLIKYVLSRIDDFRTVLTGLEKKVDEMKHIVRELQEESLKILSSKGSNQVKTDENKIEIKQLSLSNFKAEKN